MKMTLTQILLILMNVEQKVMNAKKIIWKTKKQVKKKGYKNENDDKN